MVIDLPEQVHGPGTRTGPSPEVRCGSPDGTFYVFPDVKAICNRLGLTSHGLALFLLEAADDSVGLACLGGECFGEAVPGSCVSAVPSRRRSWSRRSNSFAWQLCASSGPPIRGRRAPSMPCDRRIGRRRDRFLPRVSTGQTLSEIGRGSHFTIRRPLPAIQPAPWPSPRVSRWPARAPRDGRRLPRGVR